MIKCPYCKRVTKKGESTGNFTTFKKLKPKGKQIISQVKCCMNCAGEKNVNAKLKRKEKQNAN